MSSLIALLDALISMSGPLCLRTTDLRLDMLVLVIDGFGESPESRKRFQTFYNAVIKVGEHPRSVSFSPFPAAGFQPLLALREDGAGPSIRRHRRLSQREQGRVRSGQEDLRHGGVGGNSELLTYGGQVDAIRQFDKVDFFFVDGDLQLRPWTQRADKARS
eukprot:748301-Hanusia_phi.AAC.1